MVFIFEDKLESPISKLYADLYKENKDLEIVYSKGNSNLRAKINEKLKESDEYIIVFIDIAPDNLEVLRIFRKLYNQFEHSQEIKRVFIMPIICAEYYYMQSLGLNLATDLKEVNDCSSLNINDHYTEFKNYEKYCKYVVTKCFKECIGEKTKFKYTKNDCSPNCCKYDNCIEIKRRDKAINMVTKYPIYFKLDIKENPGIEIKNYEQLCKIRRYMINKITKLEEIMVEKGIIPQKSVYLEV